MVNEDEYMNKLELSKLINQQDFGILVARYDSGGEPLHTGQNKKILQQIQK